MAAVERGHRIVSDPLNRKCIALGIPVIILSTLVGTTAFASPQESEVSVEVKIGVEVIGVLAPAPPPDLPGRAATAPPA